MLSQHPAPQLVDILAHSTFTQSPSQHQISPRYEISIYLIVAEGIVTLPAKALLS